ncbi:mitochondrial cardiolipin hydrolase [Temnothorax curvispinosus]|uniref:Mitochondrial cardiolipin hydrolase n=1 Tax=Temnothorax curvispinosus TaxID=300111 RepID=A0A6J1PVU2_9HYME|nr:mitochondrial cardiolipin hydrolase [Temnothorax curvispinosus]
MMRSVAIVITSGALVTEVMWQLYKVYKCSRRKTINTVNGCATQLCTNTEAKIFEVMFFSKDSTLCRTHLGLMKPCGRLNCAVRHLRRIVDYLDSATDTLDICVYFFTFSDLAEAVIRAKKRNVVIRMILDESMATNDTSKLKIFYKEGIQLRSKQLDTLMHHKFVIIDNKILISGSINWTKSAFFGNFENVLVTNESAIVKPFINEFESIWSILGAITTQANSIKT